MLTRAFFIATLLLIGHCAAAELNSARLAQLGEVQAVGELSNPFDEPDTPVQFELAGIGLVEFRADSKYRSYGRQVMAGSLYQSGVRLHYSEAILVKSNSGRFDASIETLQNRWLLLSDARGYQLIRRTEQPLNDKSNTGAPLELLNFSRDSLPNLPAARAARSPSADIDRSGKRVIDIFVGFSTRAASYLADIDSYAILQVASVNRALANSGIDNVRVRLVGTGITEQGRGMDIAQLPQLQNWFSEDIARTSPDIVAAIMKLDASLPHQAGSWGAIDGYYNLAAIDQGSAFRHGIGHNMGGHHCNRAPQTDVYQQGFDNGLAGTILCANTLNYYSNPELSDDSGLALGAQASADMARLWRENSRRKSGHRPALIPFDNERRQRVLQRQVSSDAKGWFYAQLNIPATAERMVVLARGARSDKLRLYARRGERPSTEQFDWASAAKPLYQNGQQALAINKLEPGELVIGLHSATANQNVLLEVYLYGAGGDMEQVNLRLSNADAATAAVEPALKTLRYDAARGRVEKVVGLDTLPPAAAGADDSASTDNPWRAEQTYRGGEVVNYRGAHYRAQWWHINQQPGSGDARSNPWRKLDS